LSVHLNNDLIQKGNYYSHLGYRHSYFCIRIFREFWGGASRNKTQFGYHLKTMN